MSVLASPMTPTLLAAALCAVTAVGLLTYAVVLRRRLVALRWAAITDPLTGVFNRAGLADTWADTAGRGGFLAVIDLDGFKPVNDTYGHHVGDLVLTVVAERLTRRAYPVARLGGDEFTAHLPTLAAAGRVAAHLGAPITIPGGATVTVTASIGLAHLDDQGVDLAVVLARADAAMYRAKTTHCGIAVHALAADDHTRPGDLVRPALRTRDLNSHGPADAAAAVNAPAPVRGMTADHAGEFPAWRAA